MNIVVTGPESSGKTNIADHLASAFKGEWVPEYARYYINSLRNKYDYKDIEVIAKKQVADYHNFSQKETDLIIFDTWLIITKVWFNVVFNKYPKWIDQQIHDLFIDLYLVCAPDIPWIPDGVRENGGEMREELFYHYIKEIKETGRPYAIIQGNGYERFLNAENILKEYIDKIKNDK